MGHSLACAFSSLKAADGGGGDLLIRRAAGKNACCPYRSARPNSTRLRETAPPYPTPTSYIPVASKCGRSPTLKAQAYPFVPRQHLHFEQENSVQLYRYSIPRLLFKFHPSGTELPKRSTRARLWGLKNLLRSSLTPSVTWYFCVCHLWRFRGRVQSGLRLWLHVWVHVFDLCFAVVPSFCVSTNYYGVCLLALICSHHCV